MKLKIIPLLLILFCLIGGQACKNEYVKIPYMVEDSDGFSMTIEEENGRVSALHFYQLSTNAYLYSEYYLYAEGQISQIVYKNGNLTDSLFEYTCVAPNQIACSKYCYDKNGNYQLTQTIQIDCNEARQIQLTYNTSKALVAADTLIGSKNNWSEAISCQPSLSVHQYITLGNDVDNFAQYINKLLNPQRIIGIDIPTRLITRNESFVNNIRSDQSYEISPALTNHEQLYYFRQTFASGRMRWVKLHYTTEIE